MRQNKILLFISLQIFLTCNIAWAQQNVKPVAFVPKPPNPDLAKLSYVPGAPPAAGSVPVPPPKPATGGSVVPPPGGNLPVSYADAAKKPAVATGQPTPKPAAAAAGAATTKKPSLITDTELRTFSEELLSKDVNNVAKHITINLQAKLERNDTTDKSPKPLLTVKNEAYKVPTIEKMRVLFDNYIADAAINENVTPLERDEENKFLDTIIGTTVMQHARKLLMDKGVLGKDPKDWKDMLKQIWFSQYSRGEGKIGSSGFEHVFLGEVKKGEVMGLHNWIYFADQEAAGKVNYYGYLREVDLGNKGKVVKVRCKANNKVVAPRTFFVGTSPEFEIALYTVCYKLRPGSHCPVKMNDKKFSIKAHPFTYRGKDMIGSAYPEVA